MGRGLDSLIKGKSQVIKMARGCFESNVVFVYRTFVNLHLIQIKVVSIYRLVYYSSDEYWSLVQSVIVTKLTT